MSKSSWRVIAFTAFLGLFLTLGSMAQATVFQTGVPSFDQSTQTPVVKGYHGFLSNSFLGNFHIIQSINHQNELDSPEFSSNEASQEQWAVLNQSGEYLAISDVFTVSTVQVGLKPLQIKPPESYFVGTKKFQTQSSRLSVAPWTVQLTKRRMFRLEQDVSLGPRDTRTHWKVSYNLVPTLFKELRDSTRHALLQLVENQQITSTLQYLYTKSYLRFLS